MDDRIKVYDEKMTKSYNSLLGGIRHDPRGESESQRTEQDQSGLLRNSHAPAAGRQHYGSGAQDPSDPALGEIHDKTD